MEYNPIIFQTPPKIPSGLSDIVKYELELREYKLRTRSILYIFLQVIGTMLLLGLIWINVKWIRLGVTIVAILMSLILLLALSYIL
jgi:hypothetical protein